MSAPQLTLYYDGKCPFCRAEMARLRGWDTASRMEFIDISLPGFDPAFLGASMADLNREMYSRSAGGTILVGTASILAAYELAGRSPLVWPLRVPVLRSILSCLYRLFARHRYTMSGLLGYRGASACTDGVCQRDL